MPIISTHGGAASAMLADPPPPDAISRNRLPRAVSRGQYRDANVWLTTATSGVSPVSLAAKGRPERSGMFSVSK
jgi:hypothetical protein